MEVKKYMIASIVLLVLKVLFGLLLRSNTLLISSLFEVLFIFVNLIGRCKKDNKKYKGLLTSLFGLLFVILTVGIIFYSIVGKVLKPSWFIILIAIIILFTRYMVTCFGVIGTYNKKKGLLLQGNMTSTIDFAVLIITIGSMILCKLGYFIKILKYSDIVGTVLIGLIVLYYAFRIIINSIKCMEDKELVKEIDENEISKQKEVKKIESIKYSFVGGIRKASVNLILADGVNITDITSFALSLQDYVLKYVEILEVNLVDQYAVKKKVHVRSKKADARNSGSRNSKTNSKKKNTKKTNKKR